MSAEPSSSRVTVKFLGLVLALAAWPAAGAEIDRLASFVAGDPPPCRDSLPEITAQPGGSFLLTWQRSGCPSIFSISNFARRFDAAGRALGPEVELWRGSDLAVAALPDGGFVAVSSAETDLGTIATGVGLHRLDAFGRPIGAPIPIAVNPSLDTTSFTPRVAVAPNGSVAVVWTALLLFDPVLISEIHGRFFDASLAPVGGEVALSTELPGFGQAEPDIAFRDDNTALVTWAEATAVNPTTAQIFGRRIDAVGEPLGAILPISKPEAGRQHLPSRVVARADRGWWVGWYSYGPLGSDVQAHVVRLGRGARPLADEQSLGVPQARQGRLGLGTDGEDNLLLLGVGADFSISGRLFGKSGLPASSPVNLSGSSPLLFLEPALAVHSSGGFLSAWSGGSFVDSGLSDLAGAILAPPCREGHSAVCLGPGGRYAVEVAWRTVTGSGLAKPLPLSASAATFGLANLAGHDVTVLLSDTDGKDLTFAATTGAEIQMEVFDKVTGAIRRFTKPLGRFASGTFPQALASPQSATVFTAATSSEVDAFPSERIAGGTVPTGAASCVPSNRILCLLGGRFRAELVTTQGDSHAGLALLRTDRSGAFALSTEPDNPLVTLSMIDGTSSNGKIWVYLGGLSSSGYKVKITDLSTAAIRTYTNPVGRLQSRADRQAF
jgi:hypothetical protein